MAEAFLSIQMGSIILGCFWRIKQTMQMDIIGHQNLSIQGGSKITNSKGMANKKGQIIIFKDSIKIIPRKWDY